MPRYRITETITYELDADSAEEALDLLQMSNSDEVNAAVFGTEWSDPQEMADPATLSNSNLEDDELPY